MTNTEKQEALALYRKAVKRTKTRPWREVFRGYYSNHLCEKIGVSQSWFSKVINGDLPLTPKHNQSLTDLYEMLVVGACLHHGYDVQVNAHAEDELQRLMSLSKLVDAQQSEIKELSHLLAECRRNLSEERAEKIVRSPYEQINRLNSSATGITIN